MPGALTGGAVGGVIGSGAGKEVAKLGEIAVLRGEERGAQSRELLRILASVETAVLDRYSESYKEIAAGLAAELPANWTSAYVLGEMGDATGQIVGFYRATDSPDPVWLELPISLYQAFRKMHDAALASGDPKQNWTSATLALQNDGTFNVDYGYDPVDVDEEDARIAAWAKRYGA